jgi:PAS domain S-box-containing protein
VVERDGERGRRTGDERALAAALRQTEAGFREFIDRCPDAVFVRRGQAIIHANDALLALLGYERAELDGRDPADTFVHASQRAALLEHRLTRPDATDLREYQWVRKDGEIVDVEAVGVTVMFEGAPARICMCRDVTERKRMQARLLMAGHLASVGTLAGGMAHELNNPLASILSNLHLIISREASDPAGQPGELREVLADVLEAAERMRSIVSRLRTFSGSDDGGRHALELPRVIDAAVELAWSELRGRARLVRDFQEVGCVQANESRLVQVVVNLLVNAAQAIPEGAAEVNEIRVSTRADAAGNAVFAVRDTGVGIPPETLPRVLVPFFTTRQVGKGAGLGLWMCHSLVTGLGGELAVESRVGAGTTVTVTLPVTTCTHAPG